MKEKKKITPTYPLVSQRQEIERAAAKLGKSISAFMVEASLKEAKRVNR